MNDRYRLKCGHTLADPSANDINIGASVWCPFCSGPSAVMGVEKAGGSPYAPPSPPPAGPSLVNDAIVDMVFDAIAISRMSSDQRANIPIDLSVGVKKRFREVLQRLGGGPTEPAKQPVDTSVPHSFTETQAIATMVLLWDYFNTPEGYQEYWKAGNANGWSPGETAVRGLKSAARLASICSANTATIDRLTQEKRELVAQLGGYIDELRREKSTRAEALLKVRFRDKKIEKYEKLLVEIQGKLISHSITHIDGCIADALE